MIISHRHRYIFIKTQKTAGTSIEIALSRYCGPDDIITPVPLEDELIRRETGGLGPQNYRISPVRWTLGDVVACVRKRRVPQFFNHCGADFIKRRIDPEVWKGYYKFCFEREPVAKFVSWYKWLARLDPSRTPFSRFLADDPRAFTVRGYELYTIHNRIVVDDVFRFEELPRAMEVIADRLALPDVPRLPRTKISDSSEVISLTDHQRRLIRSVYAREVALFGY